MPDDAAAIRRLADWCRDTAKGILSGDTSLPSGIECAEQLRRRLLEAGLVRMATRINPARWRSNRRTAQYLCDWDERLLQLVEASAKRPAAPTKAPSKPRPKRTLDARNRWIYERCIAEVPYQTIIIQLKKKPKSWDRIESIQGIRAAAVRYAAQNGLPQIPRRQDL